MSNRLDLDRLRAELNGTFIGRELVRFQEVTSTNDIATDFGKDGHLSGTVIFAETQTKGRGRLGRVWESSPGAGLWFSILIRPEWPLPGWSRLATWAAVGIAEGIESLISQPAWVKWPNDIYIQDRKVCGILIESFVERNGFAVVGIGINVNQENFPPPLDETAISLRQATGAALSREDVAAAILQKLDRRFPQVARNFGSIVQAASERSYLRGRRIDWEQNGARFSGIAEDLDEEGALIIRTDSGRMEKLSSGEVTLAFAR